MTEKNRVTEVTEGWETYEKRGSEQSLLMNVTSVIPRGQFVQKTPWTK